MNSYKDLLSLYKEALSDYELLLDAGSKAFADEDAFYKAVEDAYGVCYELEEKLAGRNRNYDKRDRALNHPDDMFAMGNSVDWK